MYVAENALMVMSMGNLNGHVAPVDFSAKLIELSHLMSDHFLCDR
jgi:hypothetical protein